MKHQTNLSKRVSIHFLFVLALIFLNCSSNATVSESTNKTEFVDQEQEITNSIGMKFRLIKAGSFIMGTKYGGVEGTDDTTHQVTLTKDYYIGAYLVTQTQFESIMGENPSHFKGPNHPVDGVTRQEANEFCRRLSVKEGITYRLPYEAEWEYAAKAGTTTEYYWGDSFDKVDEYEWYGGNSSNQTHPVGQKKPNPWRLYDICGNLEEYTLDNYYPKFSPGPHVDPKGSAKPWGTLDTTMKSGNYRWPYPTHSRPAHRHGVYADPNDRVATIGFRIVRDLFFTSRRKGNGDIYWVDASVIKKIKPIESNKIVVAKLGPNLYKFTHEVMNMVVSIGRDGVFCSDVMEASLGPKIQSAIHELGGKEVKVIINTHWHHDHTGGNQYFAKYGNVAIISHPSVRELLSTSQYVTLFDEHYSGYPDYAVPDLTFTNRMTIHFNREDIEIISLPQGHTEGDLIVYFKKSNVLHIGDLYFHEQFPSIDYERGGDVEKFAKNLNHIMETMPEDVMIVSGHLDDCTIADLGEYRDMLSATTAIVRQAKSQGKSLAEMKQAKILKDWESWGKHVTCNMWIETIFHCLEFSDKSESK